jgi:hypothetical protein
VDDGRRRLRAPARAVSTAGSDQFGIPLVWGVYVDHVHDLILASDFGSGLWLIRPTGLKNF